jgi:hypothetical protein
VSESRLGDLGGGTLRNVIQFQISPPGNPSLDHPTFFVKTEVDTFFAQSLLVGSGTYLPYY